MPVMQWLYFDALECLPEEGAMLTEAECKPVCVKLIVNLKTFLLTTNLHYSVQTGCEPYF